VLGALYDAIEQITHEPFSAAQTSDPGLRVKVLEQDSVNPNRLGIPKLATI
jgi:hypothetical protein